MIVTKTQIENYLMTEIDPAFDSQLNDWIAAVEAYMDRFTDRKLIVADTATTNYYDGRGMGNLNIDDCRDVEEVRINEQLVENAQYMAYPYNKGYKFQLRHKCGVWPGGVGNITVKAKWGAYEALEVPKDLIFAATVLVGGIIKAAGNQGPLGAEVKSETIGRYSVSYVTDGERKNYMEAMGILNSYRRRTV